MVREVTTITCDWTYCLVPTLDCSPDRAKDDRYVHGARLTPLVKYFIAKRFLLFFLQAFDGLEFGRILSDQCTAHKNIRDVVQLVLLGEFSHVSYQPVPGNASQGILNPMPEY